MVLSLQLIIEMIGYKFLSQELTRFRMKTVDENKSIRKIEEIIASGMVEELIYAAHNELKLIRIMKNWKPWEHLYGEVQDKEMFMNMLNVKADNPFPSPIDNFEAQRHDKPPRKPTSSIHPEEEKIE